MKEYAIKVCPRCGEELFADMHVCYGCLYEFPPGRDVPAPASPAVPKTEETASAAEEPLLPELVEDEPFLWDAGLPPAESGWEDDTLDLSGVGNKAIATDRDGTFQPETVKKRETILANGMADQIIEMYAKAPAHVTSAATLSVSSTQLYQPILSAL